jgi:hypothetical protein
MAEVDCVLRIIFGPYRLFALLIEAHPFELFLLDFVMHVLEIDKTIVVLAQNET